MNEDEGKCEDPRWQRTRRVLVSSLVPGERFAYPGRSGTQGGTLVEFVAMKKYGVQYRELTLGGLRVLAGLSAEDVVEVHAPTDFSEEMLEAMSEALDQHLRVGLEGTIALAAHLAERQQNPPALRLVRDGEGDDNKPPEIDACAWLDSLYRHRRRLSEARRVIDHLRDTGGGASEAQRGG